MNNFEFIEGDLYRFARMVDEKILYGMCRNYALQADPAWVPSDIMPLHHICKGSFTASKSKFAS